MTITTENNETTEPKDFIEITSATFLDKPRYSLQNDQPHTIFGLLIEEYTCNDASIKLPPQIEAIAENELAERIAFQFNQNSKITLKGIVRDQTAKGFEDSTPDYIIYVAEIEEVEKFQF